MAHISLRENLPGIVGLLAFRPETAEPLGLFTDALLQGPSPLSRAEREMIAAHVSFRNDCHFCRQSHAAVGAEHLGGHDEHYSLFDAVQRDPAAAPVSAKMKALLAIAGLIQRDGKAVTPEAIARARAEGATDVEIHDTVLIAAAFCMFNRYVDGLGTWQPEDPAAYRGIGRQIADSGYAAAGARAGA
ncbi:MAG: carboxymuconolactone decarboxylase family protein [Acidobacteria bacterium]|nr:carboxymuconolactone decarboxylase family protein [Acidobacteriota bacterium]